MSPKNPLPPGTKKIPLSGCNGSGLFALVSDIDYDKVKRNIKFSRKESI